MVGLLKRLVSVLVPGVYMWLVGVEISVQNVVACSFYSSLPFTRLFLRIEVV